MITLSLQLLNCCPYFCCLFGPNDLDCSSNFVNEMMLYRGNIRMTFSQCTKIHRFWYVYTMYQNWHLLKGVSVNTTSAHRRPVFVHCHSRPLGIDRQCTHSLHRSDMAYCHFELCVTRQCRDCGLGCFSELLLADIRRLLVVAVVFLYQITVFLQQNTTASTKRGRRWANGADVVFTDTVLKVIWPIAETSVTFCHRLRSAEVGNRYLLLGTSFAVANPWFWTSLSVSTRLLKTCVSGC